MSILLLTFEGEDGIHVSIEMLPQGSICDMSSAAIEEGVEVLELDDPIAEGLAALAGSDDLQFQGTYPPDLQELITDGVHKYGEGKGFETSGVSTSPCINA